MCMNDLLREETFHFQSDEQFALENGKDSEAMTMVEESFKTEDRLLNVSFAPGSHRFSDLVEFSLNCESLFSFRPNEKHSCGECSR